MNSICRPLGLSFILAAVCATPAPSWANDPIRPDKGPSPQLSPATSGGSVTPPEPAPGAGNLGQGIHSLGNLLNLLSSPDNDTNPFPNKDGACCHIPLAPSGNVYLPLTLGQCARVGGAPDSPDSCESP